MEDVFIKAVEWRKHPWHEVLYLTRTQVYNTKHKFMNIWLHHYSKEGAPSINEECIPSFLLKMESDLIWEKHLLHSRSSTQLLNTYFILYVKCRAVIYGSRQDFVHTAVKYFPSLQDCIFFPNNGAPIFVYKLSALYSKNRWIQMFINIRWSPVNGSKTMLYGSITLATSSTDFKHGSLKDCVDSSQTKTLMVISFHRF